MTVVDPGRATNCRFRLFRNAISEWVSDYTTERPHSALGYTTPARFATTITAIGTDAPMAHPRQNGASTAETQVVAG